MSSPATVQTLEVNKQNFHDSRWREAPAPRIDAGQLLLSVDRFAFTANNITYAAYGDILGYWHFYPASEGWGVIPVWGFADVVESRVEGVEVGERLFGYWPMSSHAVLTPSEVQVDTVVEGVSNRQALNPFYNRYSRCAADPGYSVEQEDWQSIFRPLGLTAFLIDEYFAEHQSWGGEQVVLASASSKTAFSTAHFMSARGANRVLGLTSPGNKGFVEDMGCYDQVVAYDELETIDSSVGTVFVDMAGDGNLQSRVHQYFGEQLCHSVTVGGTHWTEIRPGLDLPGPKPEFFFAPDQIIRRIGEWGPKEFHSRFTQAWLSLMPRVQGSLKLVEGSGQAAVEDVYNAFLDGSASADKGYILKL